MGFAATWRTWASVAVLAMSKALGSPCAVGAAAHLPGDTGADLTVLRLEGFEQSVTARAAQLREALAAFGEAELLADSEAGAVWNGLRHLQAFAGAACLWRIQTTPSRAADLADALADRGADWCFDWGGALIWAGAPDDCDVRTLAGAHGAQAMLVRASDVMRSLLPTRHPQASGVAALSGRVKRVFDPAEILDPLRFA